MRVAVLMGGLSKERDVSLVTGAECSRALRAAGHEVVEVDVDRDICVRLTEVKPDVCFNALHGPVGEDGSIQGLLNVLRINYTHSGVLASALAMDKVRTKIFVSQLGVRCPQGVLVDEATYWSANPQKPYVLKPVNDGSSIHTFLVRSPARRPFAKGNWPFAGSALMEDMIVGTELTVTVLGDRALTVTEISSSRDFYDYAAKYEVGASSHFIPARISDKAFDTCLAWASTIHKAMGCRGISRSDFILENGSDDPVFLEINTQPGMTPTSLAPEQARHVGISFETLVQQLVMVATTD